MTKTLSLFAILSALASAPAEAHSYSEINLPEEGFTADLGISAAYRSESLVRSDEAWVIPGALMGGEALPSKSGISLDEVFLVPSFRRDQTYGFLKVGRHLGSEDLELDHVVVGHAFTPSLALELGQMAAIFTPFNGQHALDTSFSSRRLVYDAIWGGQYNDQGVRLKAHVLGFDAGIELWKGGSFPAQQSDTDRSAYDVYLRYSLDSASSRIQLGAYRYQAEAVRREDARYTAGHSHGTAITIDPSYFDGNVAVHGLTILSRFSFDTFAFGFQGELSQMNQEGRLWDLTHEADFENETLGLWGEVFVSHASDTLSVRSERLKIKNDIYGSAAVILGQKLRLIDATEDPYRHTMSYEYRFSETIRSRIEWSKDFTTGDTKDIVTLGAVWSDTLIRSNPTKD